MTLMWRGIGNHTVSLVHGFRPRNLCTVCVCLPYNYLRLVPQHNCGLLSWAITARLSHQYLVPNQGHLHWLLDLDCLLLHCEPRLHLQPQCL